MRAIKNKGAARRDHRKHDKKTIINKDGRTCNKCASFKSWNEYYIRDDSYTGHMGSCIECTKEVMKRNREARKCSKDSVNLHPVVDSNLANMFLMGRI